MFFCPSFPLSLRRVYVINKEICVRTVCAHEELLKGKFDRNFGKRTSNLASDIHTTHRSYNFDHSLMNNKNNKHISSPLSSLFSSPLPAGVPCAADLCRDQFSRCGVAALGGHCGSMGGSCGKSCGGCWTREMRDILDLDCTLNGGVDDRKCSLFI